MDTISINGKCFPVIAEVQTGAGETLPLVGIPLMSDETWNQLSELKENPKPPKKQQTI